MRVERYTHDFQEQWEAFIEKSLNGTMMQERRFLNYHPKGRFEDHSLIFYKNKEIIAILPAAKIYENSKTILSSHPGASHGGLIIKRNIGTSKAIELVRAFIEYSENAEFDAIALKCVPKIYHRDLSDQLDFALRYWGFNIKHTELATALNLSNEDEAIITKSLSSTALRNYHKALKSGVEVREDGRLRDYWPVLVKRLQQNHKAHPTHTLEEIQSLQALYPHNIKLFSAHMDGKLIAGVLVFLLNERVINCFYIAHDDQYQELRPLNLIFAHLLEWGRKNQFMYLDWGISTEAKGSRVNTGLFRFKEGFGGSGVLRETYVRDLR